MAFKVMGTEAKARRQDSTRNKKWGPVRGSGGDCDGYLGLFRIKMWVLVNDYYP